MLDRLRGSTSRTTGSPTSVDQYSKLPELLKLPNTDPFAAWFVVTGDATPDGIRVVRSVLGAIFFDSHGNGGQVAELDFSNNKIADLMKIVTIFEIVTLIDKED